MKNYRLLNRNLINGNFVVRKLKIIYMFGLIARNYLIKIILMILSYIIPKNKKILLFSSVGNYDFPIFLNEKDYQFKESPKYLAIYSAKKLKEHKTYFHIPNKKMFPEIKRLNIIPVKGLFSFWIMLRAKYIFVDNNNFFNPNASFLIGRFNIIQCWHGTPLKKMGDDKKTKKSPHDFIKKIENRKYNYILSTCRYTTKIFKKLFNSDDILEIGSPRNDILLNPSFFSTENIAKKLNLKKYKKIFLYAPTFRKLEKEVNPFDKKFLKKLNKILNERKNIFLIKQHPYTKKIENLEAYSNILDISKINQDIQEILIYTSVLITDYSSVIFDFALLNRPLIFFAKDLKKYEKERGLYFNYYKIMPGPIITRKENLLKLINNTKSLYTKKNLRKISKFNNTFNKYQDGKSCERLFKILLK